jgi:ABC-type transport system substrate-binding protein
MVRDRRSISARSGSALLAVLALVGSLSVGAGATTARAASTSYDPKGVLRLGYDVSGLGGPVFDPVKVTANDPGVALGQLLFDSLLHKQANGALVPSLATSATIVDPQTIKIALRSGVKFQDKTALDADAVKFTLLRNRDASSVAFPAAIKSISSVDVDGPLALTIHLNAPVAGSFYPLLGDLATMPVSPTAVAKNDSDPVTNPLGAGPFRVKEYVPEQRLVLTKSPDYWNAKNIKLGGVEYVQAAAGPASITALKSGAVDVVQTDLSQLQALSGGGIKTATGNSGTSLLYFQVCKSRKPLDDVRVRQALSYALDRDAINKALTNGLGQPAWSLVPPDNALYNAKLTKHYAYSVKKAKALLKAAGYADGVSLSMIPQQAGTPTEFAEIAQQYWKKVGIDVQIKPSTNIVQDLFMNHTADMGATSVVRNGLDALQFIYTPGHLGDLCDYEDPQLTAIIDKLSALPANDPQAKKLWSDAQEFVIGNALNIYVTWLPAVLAYDSTKVGGIKVAFPGVSPYPDFYTAFVKK